MIVSLWGKVGAGKGTVAQFLCQKLWYEHVSVWAIKRKKAEQMGIDIHEFNRLGSLPENTERFEHDYELYQQSLNLTDKIVLDSRLAFYNQPHSFKVFLQVSDEIAARRLLNDTKRFWEVVGNYDMVLEKLKTRNSSDRTKYLKIYGVDIHDIAKYNVIIDTDQFDAQQVADIVLFAFEKRMSNKPL